MNTCANLNRCTCRPPISQNYTPRMASTCTICLNLLCFEWLCIELHSLICIDFLLIFIDFHRFSEVDLGWIWGGSGRDLGWIWGGSGIRHGSGSDPVRADSPKTHLRRTALPTARRYPPGSGVDLGWIWGGSGIQPRIRLWPQKSGTPH